MFRALILLTLLSVTSLASAEIISVNSFINSMVNEHGFDKKQLQQLFKQVKKKNNILRVMKRPGEAKPWYEYRKIFLTSDRIKQGAVFWRKHAKTLERAEKTYGVPVEIIVAIIGVETFYGKQLGKFRIIDALYTLGFHYPKRADFFRKELKEFLLLTREENVNPLHPKGSYAGAIGYGQFIPSSYRNYAIDFDGDGQRNLWNDVEDSIGSVANYLRNYSKSYGWKPDQAVIKATKVRPNAVKALLDLEFKPTLTVRQLKQRGLQFATNKYDNYLGLLIDLKTEQGTLYWVGFNNFYMLTRYNKSNRYAMAVYQLAQAIKASYNE
ncbi:lytic murein transglycosylase B [Candidatus Albibeggiatoa sp. nov. NOAA]|uniref:lytic murein transglycosylase B n=1 Tax=Candidatus Albibeggiatoa sp. nov. NOAA TaxID=3162724 RepID=UPI0032FC19F2|nr:lytic murein transglycosylase B [Thiotrichaceae bacterium]